MVITVIKPQLLVFCAWNSLLTKLFHFYIQWTLVFTNIINNNSKQNIYVKQALFIDSVLAEDAFHKNL